MGYVKKERRGRKAFFFVERESEEKEVNKAWAKS
jgi:hypothetical protein